MINNYRIFDLILQNNASKQEWVIRGLQNTSESHLSYVIDNFEMPADAPEGEYFYALVWNIREDVEYELKDDILSSIVHTSDSEMQLRDLQPEIGLMRYGNVETKNTYRNKNNEFLYRK